jgi:hypothetical protein
LSDANAHLAANRDPVDRMLGMLETYFRPEEPNDADDKLRSTKSLAITYGRGGACFSHGHTQQYEFVHQSLSLWREIQD